MYFYYYGTVYKHIEWLFEVINRADVSLTDGRFELNVFSHPFEYHVGDEITDGELTTSNVTEVYLEAPSTANAIQKIGEPWDYSCLGTVVDEVELRVSVRHFIINIGYLPGDIEVGDKVSFKADRIDFDNESP